MCACITLRFSPKIARYICYILVPQKGTEIALARKPKAKCLIIKYRSTSTRAIHCATLQSSLYIRLPTKLQYIYILLERPEPPNHCFNSFIIKNTDFVIIFCPSHGFRAKILEKIGIRGCRMTDIRILF